MRPPAEPASGSKALVYNECDQLTSWPGMYAYEYDSAGNLIRTRARSSSGPIAAEYTYTDDGLLHTASCGGTTTLTNTWDAMGNRVGLTVGSDQYSFLYNPIAGVPAVLVETGPDTTYYYYRDPRGVLIARFDTDPLNEDPWRYYHYDELGSTRLLTDEDGEVTDEYAYDAYGNTITHLGTTQDNPYQWVGALGYYTHHQAPEFRLIQLGFRFYDPEIGRFTQQDPIGDGLNWYAYCGGNPLGYTDPWGLTYDDAKCCFERNGDNIRWVALAWGIQPELLGGVVYSEMYAGGKPAIWNEIGSEIKFILGMQSGMGITQLHIAPGSVPGGRGLKGRLGFMHGYLNDPDAQLNRAAQMLARLSVRRYGGNWMSLNPGQMSIIWTEYNRGRSRNGIGNQNVPGPNEYGRRSWGALPTIREWLDVR